MSQICSKLACRGIPAALCLVMSLLTGLVACDSSSDIPVQQVAEDIRLNDNELQQLQSEDLHQKQHRENLKHEHQVFNFGFDLRSSPQEDAAQYLPFLEYLEKTTGYHFQLHFTPKNSTTADELGQSKVQFASMGATSYLDAQSRYEVVSLVRGINHQGKAEYQSVLVVKNNSPIRSIKDFKGRSFAFGSRSSTQGHLIPRIMLRKQGLSLKDLSRYGYTGSHQNCAEAVVAGKYDICGMQDQLAEKLVQRGLVRIIYRSAFYPSSGIVVNRDVPQEVTDKVKKALLGFYPQGKHRKGLYNWDQTEMPRGFLATDEKDYSDLKQWSIQLGFLKNKKK